MSMQTAATSSARPRMDVPQQLFWGFLMALALTEFSYKYIEQPELGWGRKLEAMANQPRSREASSIEVAAVVPAKGSTSAPSSRLSCRRRRTTSSKGTRR